MLCLSFSYFSLCLFPVLCVFPALCHLSYISLCSSLTVHPLKVATYQPTPPPLCRATHVAPLMASPMQFWTAMSEKKRIYFIGSGFWGLGGGEKTLFFLSYSIAIVSSFLCLVFFSPSASRRSLMRFLVQMSFCSSLDRKLNCPRL